MENMHVMAVAVTSLDGFIAGPNGAPPNQIKKGGWTSPEDKGIFKRLFKSTGVAIIGSSTLLQSPKMWAKLSRKHEVPLVVVHRGLDGARTTGILSALGRADSDSCMVCPANHPCPRDAIARLQEKYGELDMGNEALVVGGTMTYTWLRNVVHRWVVVVEPVFLGAGRGLFSASAAGFAPPVFLDAANCEGAVVLNDRGTVAFDLVPMADEEVPNGRS